MKSRLETINPKDIYLDMTTDPKNVEEIKRQIVAWKGIHTPIEIWWDMRTERLMIADGFHRTKAALELGLENIEALVLDCTEEEFWDKRISQAKKHTSIADDRLYEWIISSWKLSSFYKSEGIKDFIEEIYNVHHGLSGSVAHSSKAEYQMILQWLIEKANLWGHPVQKVAEKILRHEKIYDPRKPQVKEVAKELNLTAGEAAKLTEVLPESKFGKGLSKQETKNYAREEIKGKIIIYPPRPELEIPSDKNEAVPVLNPIPIPIPTPTPVKPVPVWKKEKTLEEGAQRLTKPPSTEEDKLKRRVELAKTLVEGLRSTSSSRIRELMGMNLDEIIKTSPEVGDKLIRFINDVAALSDKITGSNKLKPIVNPSHRTKSSRNEDSRKTTVVSNPPIRVDPTMLAMDSSQIDRMP